MHTHSHPFYVHINCSAGARDPSWLPNLRSGCDLNIGRDSLWGTLSRRGLHRWTCFLSPPSFLAIY